MVTYFDFSSSNCEQFKREVSELNDAMTNPRADKENQYLPLKKAFLEPEKYFLNLEKQSTGVSKATTKNVQDFIVEFADKQISQRTKELGIEREDLEWDSKKIQTPNINDQIFTSRQRQNLNNMSNSPELIRQNQAERSQRNFENSFIGKVSKLVNESVKEQAGSSYKALQKKTHSEKARQTRVSSFTR